MKTQLARILIPWIGSLLFSCSDATQFAEQVLPSSADSSTSAPGSGQRPNSDVPGKTDNPDSMEGPGSKPGDSEGPVYGGNTENPSSNPNPTPSTPSPGGSTPGGQKPGETTPPSGTDSPAQSDKVLFEDCAASTSPIVAKVYELPSNTKQLPNFGSLPSVDTTCVDQLNITDRDFMQGFPGVPDLIEWFGLDMRFRLYVPVQGSYNFTLRSDDGSILLIDNQVVVNNDGVHAVTEKSGFIALTKGYHNVQVKYFQGPRVRIALELFWKEPGASTRSYIPSNYLARP